MGDRQSSCLTCGAMVQGERTTKKFCSGACRQKFYRIRSTDAQWQLVRQSLRNVTLDSVSVTKKGETLPSGPPSADVSPSSSPRADHYVLAWRPGSSTPEVVAACEFEDQAGEAFERAADDPKWAGCWLDLAWRSLRRFRDFD